MDENGKTLESEIDDVDYRPSISVISDRVESAPVKLGECHISFLQLYTLVRCSALL